MEDEKQEIIRLEALRSVANNLKDADNWSREEREEILSSISENNKSRYRNAWFTILLMGIGMLEMNGFVFSEELSEKIAKFKSKLDDQNFFKATRRSKGDVEEASVILDGVLSELEKQGVLK